MESKKDITTKEDIKLLVDTFYDEIKKNKSIGYFFTEIANLDWDKHLSKMYLFWESIVFKNAVYKGNPMLKHIALHQKESLKLVHFKQWLALWEENVNAHFSGKNATEIVYRAKQIADLMEFKVVKSKI